MKFTSIINRSAVCAAFVGACTLALDINANAEKTAASPSLVKAQQSLQRFTSDYKGIHIARTVDQRVRGIYGKPFSTGSSALESTRAFLSTQAEIFGAEASEFELVGGFSNRSAIQPLIHDPATDTYKFTNVAYHQVVSGIPVYGSRLTLLSRNEPGHPVVQAAADVKRLDGFVPNPDRAPMPDYGQAIAAGAKFLGTRVELATDPAYVIYAGGENQSLAPRLGVQFEIMAGTKSDDTYQRWLLITDDETGEVLHQENRVVNCGIAGCTSAAHAVTAVATADVSGTVTSLSTEGSGADICEPELSFPMPYAYVAGNNGSSTYADAFGNFTLPSSGSVTVTSGFSGQYFAVNNDQGSDATFNAVIPNGGNADVNNSLITEYVLAQSDAYLHSNIVRDFVLSYSPSYPVIGGESGFPVNVNLGSSCNAYYDYSSINFYNEAGGCSNTAFSVIVHHEYGHHLVACAGSGQGEYGEGMGDVMGVLITGDPQLARGFFTNDCTNGIRNADNNCLYDASGCSTCGSAIHSCGQLISGVVWDLVQIMEAYDPVNGYDTVARIVIDSMPLHSGSSINGTILLDYLTLDDDDNDLSNGTPHFDQIQEAFQLHNMGDIPEPLDNDDCVTARDITWGTWDVNTVGALSSGVPVDESQCTDTYMTACDPDVWYRLVACGTGSMTVSLCDLVNFDSDLAVYAGSCDGLTQVACNGDASGCGGYTSQLSVNVDQGQTYYIRVGGYQGATGSGSMTVTGPGEPCDGGTIAFDFPDGLPDVVDPDGSTVIRLEITGDDSITPAPGSAAMYYLQDDTVMVGSLNEVSDNVYDASFGSLQCLPLEYWFTVNDTEGTEYISSTFNADVYTDLVIVFEDDGESDAGWTVSGAATDGQWDRGIPVNCNRGDPPTDADGSGRCWLTDNDSANSCNSDVDGGATILTSPVLDASNPGTTISYTYWYSNDFGGGPNNDFFTIEASDDGGGSWQTIEVIGPAGPGGWITSTFSIASIAGISPSDNFRLRFTAEDAAEGSVIEAGVDSVIVSVTDCETTECTGDLDGNGQVNVNDLLQLIGAWGNPYDVNDLLELIGAWGECP